MPLIGYVDEITRSRVAGWVHDLNNPNEPVTISIFVNGFHRGSCLANRSRPDLTLAAVALPSTDRAFAFRFDPLLSPFEEQAIELVATWSGERLPNGRQILPKPAGNGEAPKLRPILVTSTGRAGTTLLMSEFARSPSIVVGDRYPYEIKQVAYHVAAFLALVGDADRERSTHPETMLSPEHRFAIGTNPYNTPGLFDLGGSRAALWNFYRRDLPASYANQFRSLIEAFYTALAGAQGKPEATLFCEKADIDEAVLEGARVFFGPVKQIVLLRDPRDVLCSAMAFWKLPPAEALAMLRGTYPQLVRAARQGGADTIVIRYEDLIREPVAIRQAISRFLDVDLAWASEEGKASVTSAHRTTDNALASIGRWRQDLTPQQIADCEDAFGPILRVYDYEPRDAPAGRAWSLKSGNDMTGNRILTAEGTGAVVECLHDDDGPGLVLDLTFGKHRPGKQFLLDGWAEPDERSVWNRDYECRLRLPAIRAAGPHRLRVVGAPFIEGTSPRARRIIILLDGDVIGTALVGAVCVLDIRVPETMTGSGKAITVTFRLPDAARPEEITDPTDDQVRGFALHRLTVTRIDLRRAAEDQALGRPVPYVGAWVEPPPILTPEWHVAAAD